MVWSKGSLPRQSETEYGNPLWDDLRFPLTREKRGQTEKPDYDFTNLGLLFPQNESGEIVYIMAQMPHSFIIGSDIVGHIHFVQDEAEQPIFKLDYRWYDNGKNPAGSFLTISATKFLYTYTSGSLLQVAAFPAIDGSGILEISSMLDLKLYRDDNVVAGDVLGKEFDIHFQQNIIGSRSEWIK